MFKNYLKIAIRNLLRQKVFSFINIVGLSIGLACCLLILLFVREESSYDKFNEKAERIFRVTTDIKLQGSEFSIATTFAPLAPAMLEDYPEVIDAVRFERPAKIQVSYNDNRFYEKLFTFADPSIFRVFDFTLLEGDPVTALSKPFSVVVSPETTRRYFGISDPIGKVIRYENQYDFMVTGVLNDIPKNSHLQFDFLASYETLEKMKDRQQTAWHDFSKTWAYILLQQKSQAAKLESKLAEIIDKYMGFLGNSGKDYFQFQLQPLTDIHLHSDLGNEISENGSAAFVYIFATVALFILIIACINFMNLSTARGMDRAKEVGMRKVLGAYRLQLIRQFLGESMLLTFLALALAIGLIEIVLPFFNLLAGKSLTINYLKDSGVLLAFPAFAIFVGILAGCYPAFVLSSYRPIHTLKGRLQDRSRRKGFTLRKILVTFQFAISIILIIGTLIVSGQLHFFKTKQLGFDKEQIMVIPVNDPQFGQKYQVIKNILNQNTHVISVSAVGTTPGKNEGNSTTFYVRVGDEDQKVQMLYIPIDHDFVKTFGFKLIAGRDFSRDFVGDTDQAFLINESAVKRLGWSLNDKDKASGRSQKSPIGKRLRVGQNREGTVIGVVKDFNVWSLQEKITPLVFFIHAESFEYLAIKIGQADISGTIKAIQRQWHEIYPKEPFEYTFVNEDFDSHYRREERLGNIFMIFSGLAILIACLGLLGLTSMIVKKSTKQIGIRKILGASIPNILTMLSSEFVKLVLLANIVAWPVAWYAMNKWLQNFAYRIEISWWVFALAGGLALLIALLTVSTKAIKAALANPVESLRYE